MGNKSSIPAGEDSITNYRNDTYPSDQFLSLIQQIISTCLLPNNSKTLTSPQLFINQVNLKTIQQLNNTYNSKLINNPIQYDFTVEYTINELKTLLINCDILSCLPIDLINLVCDFLKLNTYVLISNIANNKLLVDILNDKTIPINSELNHNDNNYNGYNNNTTQLFNSLICTEFIHENQQPYVFTSVQDKTICYYRLDLQNEIKLSLKFKRPINSFWEEVPIYQIIHTSYLAVYTGFSIEIYNIKQHFRANIIDNDNSNNNNNESKNNKDSNNKKMIFIDSILSLIAPVSQCNFEQTQLLYNKHNKTLILIAYLHAFIYNIQTGQLLNIVSLVIKLDKKEKIRLASNHIITTNNQLLYIDRSLKDGGVSNLLYINTVNLNINDNDNHIKYDVVDRLPLDPKYTLPISEQFYIFLPRYCSKRTNSNNNATNNNNKSSNNNNDDSHHIFVIKDFIAEISMVDYRTGNLIYSLHVAHSNRFTRQNQLMLNLNTKVNEFARISDESIHKISSPFFINQLNSSYNSNNYSNNNDNSNNKNNNNNNNNNNSDNNSHLIGYLYHEAEKYYLVFIDLYNTMPLVIDNNNNNVQCKMLNIIPIPFYNKILYAPLVRSEFKA